MVCSTAFSVALVALASTSCSAFVPAARIPRVSQRSSGVVRASTPVMSMKSAGSKGGSSINKAASIISKALFSRPGSNNGGGNMGGGGGMMGGGGNNKGNSKNEQESFEGGDSLGGVAMMGVLASLKDGAGGAWDAYNGALEENPILVKACTSLVGFSIGDVLAQKSTTAKDGNFSYARLCRMAAFGFLFHGTISHFFYNALDGALPGTAAVTVIQKVVIDQVLWAPIFTIIFFTWLGATSGASPNEIVTKIKNDLVKGVVGSWTVWPLAHTINFRFVPTEQRLLYINSIQIFYNVFLSIIGSK